MTITNPHLFQAAACLLAGSLAAHADTLPSASSYALDSMAPDGRWATRIEVRNNSYDQWYDDDGKQQKFNAAYDGLNLDSSVFPSLALFGAGATLGTTSLNSRQNLQAVQIILGYGVREDVTIGLILPFVKTRNSIDFSVVGGNVGFNPAFNPSLPIGPGNFPLAPVGGGVVPLGTSGVKQLLTDPTFGYGYAPIGNSETSGLSDSTLGVLWRGYQDQRSSAVLGFGVRFGIAKGDDPDNLTDVPIGDGSNDLRLRLEYFRDLGMNFDLHLLAENFTQLADHVVMRVPQSGQLLASSSSKERLRRDLGDYREYDFELGHRWEDWRVSATKHLYIKSGDHYTSDKGTDTSALEAHTNIRADQWRANVAWSGINAWRQQQFPIPLIIKLEMQDTYGGRNFPKVRDYYLQLTTFF